ncbi:hypothetical protein ACWDR3_12840 [Streptomyces sp. NPDC001002]
MSDRSLRLFTLSPLPARGGERGAVLLRERPASPPDAPSGKKTGDGDDTSGAGQSGGGQNSAGGGGSAGQDDNPFAPPPEGTPDRPWQPRRPTEGDEAQSDSGSSSPSPWGSQWSDRQPGRSQGGFGDRPGDRPGPSAPENPGGNGPNTGMRWDPTDPIQRRARYSLLSGMWAFFFALFSWPYVALLLGALSLYWGISALRAKSRAAQDTTDTSAPRPQTTAAISGLVTATLAIALVAATFAAQLVYSDYYTCTSDALTNQAKQACEQHLPSELRNILGTNG